ncbi:MAG: hypothetical protein AAEA79_03100 [Nitrososphaerales archaeon]|jgi:hypothetical protein
MQKVDYESFGKSKRNNYEQEKIIKDPFGKFEDINIQKAIPRKIIKDIKRKKEFIENGINRIEEASKIKYPEYYVEPILPIAFTSLERESPTPYFARNIFHIWKGEVRIIIQLSAPLIAFGLKGTIQAILAHEFLHYIEYVRKFERLDIISDEVSSTLFEAKYADACRSFKPELIFTHSNKSPQIIKHLREKFQNHSVGERLIKKTKEDWINKSLPVRRVSLENNVSSIPIETIMKTRFDSDVGKTIRELEQNAKKSKTR